MNILDLILLILLSLAPKATDEQYGGKTFCADCVLTFLKKGPTQNLKKQRPLCMQTAWKNGISLQQHQSQSCLHLLLSEHFVCLPCCVYWRVYYTPPKYSINNEQRLFLFIFLSCCIVLATEQGG